jgi:hypothetical protein
MKTRIEAARFVERLLNGDSYSDEHVKLVSEKSCHHFGKVELRTLFDFIWESLPETDDELLGSTRKLRNNTAAKNKRFDDDKGS